MMKRFNHGPSILFFAVLLLLWEAAVRLWSIDPWMLPAPSLILKTLAHEWTRIPENLIATAWIAICGLLSGLAIGLVSAVVLHLSALLKKMIYPLLVLSQNIPLIALAPLLILWLGFGMEPKVIVVALVCFFPITVSTLDGFQQTDRTLIMYMEMAGASRLQRFFKLEWPSALPSFFSGCKLAATYSVMGAVIAEWLGAKDGLGVMMQLASSSFRTDRVFVAILLVAGLSLLLFAAISLIEAWTLRWQIRKGGDGREA
ncbi:ABC transporter permease [Polycladomyces sp. WAk]|uniref:ABC transporter permease n=1 Tax=Polycladomyces zharkentensis TaxID=2807616 RepID=A0ABS2WEJ7_9BACL|nr:ABC transporter permease [Polycladomyces sp. WAk]MBN2907967.1 ABC transporter permease [Polycladomyces sp. WAk]